ncbi:hypothetical protein MsAc7_07270 [Methanolapillus millepedarum]|uniref:Uncharacterized protein n=1 Tax=Methanolapillus millepedarum TaxID=3028296 RepID=A0AA96V3S6_9EURY|nr:hypothetical protein MsAc7_07270 [Methanosarcinaceae archaeon Ac7]
MERCGIKLFNKTKNCYLQCCFLFKPVDFFDYQLHLLFSVQIAPTVYSSDCTYYFQFRLHLPFSVQIASTIYSSDCICHYCTNPICRNPNKQMRHASVYSGGFARFLKETTNTWPELFDKRPVFDSIQKIRRLNARGITPHNIKTKNLKNKK